MTGARVIRLNGCSSAPGFSIYQPQLLEKLLGVLDSPKVEERRMDGCCVIIGIQGTGDISRW